MVKKNSLKIKTQAICALLVIVPMILIGTFSLRQFDIFKNLTVSEAYGALINQAQQLLDSGLKKDHATIQSFIQNAETDLTRLTTSMNSKNFMNAHTNSTNDFAIAPAKKAATIVNENILKACQAQKKMLYQKLNADLTVVDYIISSRGGIEEEGLTQQWNVENQITHEKSEVVLPVLQVGFDPIAINYSLENPSPIVDKVKELVNVPCAIFQKMDGNGNMLIVASNEKDEKDNRAIGKYIPATDSKGELNPIITSILSGKIFKGRAYIANNWYISTFKPLKNEDDTIIGMVFVGVKENDIKDFKDAILSYKIGEMGYPAIIDSNGRLIMHPKDELIGKNIIKDLNINKFSEILDSYKSVNMKMISYEYDNAEQFAVCNYFEPWDWIILTTGYLNDFIQTNSLVNGLKNEVSNLLNTATVIIDEKPLPIYLDIEYINTHGKTVLSFQNGSIDKPSEYVANEQFFIQSTKFAQGEIYNSGVIHKNGQNLIKMASPIFYEKKLVGVVVIDIVWDLANELLKSRIYGKSGYSYIIDDAGLVISHPKYTIKDNIKIDESKYGKLSEFFKNKIQKGEKGSAKYSFNNIEYYASFTPLKIGKKNYFMVATIPVNELLSIANKIKDNAQHALVKINRAVLFSGFALLIFGLGIGFVFSRSITKPIDQIVTELMKAEKEGDLNINVNVKKQDEIGKLGNWINSFTGKLQNIIKDITKNSKILNHSSIELSDLSEQMLSNAEKVFEKSNNVSVAAEQMSINVKHNAESIKEASASINMVAISAKEMSGTIENIAQNSLKARSVAQRAVIQTQNASQEVNHLGLIADEIGNITKMITKISRQIHLLALNATIEANRAGKYGRGFSVVAHEIKELANQASEATSNIKEQIDGIQNSSGKTIREITNAKDIIDEVNNIVFTITTSIEEQSQTTKEIASNISNASQKVTEVNNTITENSYVTEKIAKDISDVNDAVAYISNSSSQVNVKASELKNMSEKLKDMVQWFKV